MFPLPLRLVLTKKGVTKRRSNGGSTWASLAYPPSL